MRRARGPYQWVRIRSHNRFASSYNVDALKVVHFHRVSTTQSIDGKGLESVIARCVGRKDFANCVEDKQKQNAGKVEEKLLFI